jgi:hypothetical protein
MIAGPYFVFDAHTTGSGKSLTADIVAPLAMGTSAPRMAPCDETETEKWVTTLVISAVL